MLLNHGAKSASVKILRRGGRAGGEEEEDDGVDDEEASSTAAEETNGGMGRTTSLVIPTAACQVGVCSATNGRVREREELWRGGAALSAI